MSVGFPPSTAFQQWMTQLRVSWMGRKAQTIMGAFAKVGGDLVYDWMVRANLEHLPEYASAPSVGLTASERQIDANPKEPTAQLATRTTRAAQLWRFAGTPLGMLLALYYAGFQNAVILQQNGLGFSLSGTPSLDDLAPLLANTIVPSWFNAQALGTGAGISPVSPGTKIIPAGTPWAVWDFNTDLCSRFLVLFPGPLPGPFRTWGVATFTGTDTAAVTWNNAFPSASYQVLPGPAVVTDGAGPISVDVDAATQTTTGITARATGKFNGLATLLAWPTGANPMANLRASDLSRLWRIINAWKPAKASCFGVSVVAQGAVWGWPVRTWGNGEKFTPSTILSFPSP